MIQQLFIVWGVTVSVCLPSGGQGEWSEYLFENNGFDTLALTCKQLGLSDGMVIMHVYIVCGKSIYSTTCGSDI